MSICIQARVSRAGKTNGWLGSLEILSSIGDIFEFYIKEIVGNVAIL